MNAPATDQLPALTGDVPAPGPALAALVATAPAPVLWPFTVLGCAVLLVNWRDGEGAAYRVPPAHVAPVAAALRARPDA